MNYMFLVFVHLLPWRTKYVATGTSWVIDETWKDASLDFRSCPSRAISYGMFLNEVSADYMDYPGRSRFNVCWYDSLSLPTSFVANGHLDCIDVTMIDIMHYCEQGIVVPAQATYSSLRTAVLGLTPGDLKCRLYCNGTSCKFCNLFKEPSVVPGLYSTWITDQILAMARPQMVHFENDVIIDHFKKCNIVAVFNLEEIGEHAHCGKGNLVNGFSYDPELFMENDIFHYNFPLPDFEACVADHMVDIVTVMVHELIRGNIAVHCHAGHGRTGTAIAACLMRTQGLTPREAVELVRSKRPSSVQSGEQVRALHSLHNFLRNSVTILPAHPFPSMLLYIEYTSRVLPKLDMRKFGNVPKPLFVGVIALLHKCFTSVTFKLEVTPNQFHCFRFKCNEPTSFRITEETLSLMNVDVTIRGQSWYADRVRRGMNILNLENFLEKQSVFNALFSTSTVIMLSKSNKSMSRKRDSSHKFNAKNCFTSTSIFGDPTITPLPTLTAG
ncbi:hypothetical protein RB195_000413 [Necator americanus]|uniref:Tyrosine specific protein phosphatases domain-containing protein n=1 Tax=Necator americanus TaxID=51031 RepID=A0ABR1D9K9_NECAM